MNTPKDQNGQPDRRNALVEINTLGGWTVTLKAMAMIRGTVQDERQFFAHLPDVPTIPFRLEEGGFGLINTANIIRASAWPKPEALPETALPLEMRGWTPSRSKSPAPRGGDSFMKTRIENSRCIAAANDCFPIRTIRTFL